MLSRISLKFWRACVVEMVLLLCIFVLDMLFCSSTRGKNLKLLNLILSSSFKSKMLMLLFDSYCDALGI